MGFGDGEMADEKRVKDINTFAQESTLHGIKHIFEPGGSRTRKTLWVCSVLAALVFLIQQLGTSLDLYFKYKVNTNVERFLPQSLDFPAVTICNLNSYRLTQTAEAGMYNFMDKFFGGQGAKFARSKQQSFISENETIRDFLKLTAHRKEDLIVSCTWAGEPCELDTDVQTIYTDVGVCYTFNGERNGTRKVERAGEGLSLVLNVEQFEHMRGPQLDAGVKVFLHDHYTSPLMQTNGFAVGPGSHYIVDIERTEYARLSSPYGDCCKTSDGMSSCLTGALNLDIATRCECYHSNSRTDSQMMDRESSMPCRMHRDFRCLMDAKANFSGSQRCHCSPCEEIKYKTDVSFAGLSKNNIDQLVSSTTVKSDLKKRYLKARDYGELYLSSFYEKNANIVGSALRGLKQAQSLLENDKFLSTDEMLSRRLQTVNIVGVGADIIKADLWIQYTWRSNALANNMNDYFKTYLTPDSGTTLCTYLSLTCNAIRIIQATQDVFEQYNDTSDPVDGCLRKIVGSDPSVTAACTSFVNSAISQLNTLNISDLTNLQIQTEARRRYKFESEIIFNGTYKSADDFSEHKQCLKSLDSFEQLIGEVFSGMAQSLIGLDGPTAIAEKAEILLYVSSNLTRDNNATYLMNIGQQLLYKDCRWYLLYVAYSSCQEEGGKCGEQQNENKKLQNFVYAKNFLKTDMNKLKYLFRVMGDAKEKAIADLNKLDQENFQKSLENYLSGSIFKSNLSKILQKQKEKILIFKESLSAMRGAMDEFTGKLEEVYLAMKKQYAMWYQYSLPVVDDDFVKDFLLVKTVLNSTHMSGALVQAASQADGQSSDGILRVVDLVYQEWISAYKSARRELYRMVLDELPSALKILEEDLESYDASGELNADFYLNNFLRVDFMYGEMMYQRIEQVPAFSVSSLFGEIGGILGLLVGASLLTFLELVEFAWDNISRLASKRSCLCAKKVGVSEVQRPQTAVVQVKPISDAD